MFSVDVTKAETRNVVIARKASRTDNDVQYSYRTEPVIYNCTIMSSCFGHF